MSNLDKKLLCTVLQSKHQARGAHAKKVMVLRGVGGLHGLGLLPAQRAVAEVPRPRPRPRPRVDEALRPHAHAAVQSADVAVSKDIALYQLILPH